MVPWGIVIFLVWCSVLDPSHEPVSGTGTGYAERCISSDARRAGRPLDLDLSLRATRRTHFLEQCSPAPRRFLGFGARLRFLPRSTAPFSCVQTERGPFGFDFGRLVMCVDVVGTGDEGWKLVLRQSGNVLLGGSELG